MTAEPLPCVWVTRPTHQAGEFVTSLQQLGFPVVQLPTMAIEFRTDKITTAERQFLANSELLIFTSANAVTGAHKCGLLEGQTTKLATIGHATATALKQHGLIADLVPPQNTSSEGFLDFLHTQQLNLKTTITIIRGANGRETLITGLRSAGTHVHMIDVYERRLPTPQKHSLQAVVDQLPCIISVTSNEGLLNLLKIVPVDLHPTLFDCELIVNSARCAGLAGELGFRQQIMLAPHPGDQGQLAALQKYMNINL